MTATLHPFPIKTSKANQLCDLVRANTDLAIKVLHAEYFAKQVHEYAARGGDALLKQMAREFLERMER
jgi:hypothetical protein